MNEALLPCPFCGRAAIQKMTSLGGNHGQDPQDFLHIGCASCGVWFSCSNYPGYITAVQKDELAARWNKRVAGAQPAGEYPALPEPDTRWRAQFAGHGVSFHSEDQIIGFANERARAAVDADRAMRAAQPAGAQHRQLTELQKDAASLLFALQGAWPYVHEFCTIKSIKAAILALLRKHGEFADYWEQEKAPAQQTPAPAQAAPAYADSTPGLHVGDSAFETWYSNYDPAHKGDKQRARDAYAAGMGDPLVTTAPAAVAGPVVNRATVIEWLDANDIEVTDRQMDGLFHSAAPTTQPAPSESTELSGELLDAQASAYNQWFNGERCAAYEGDMWSFGRAAWMACATQPSPASQGDALDAARYRWLRNKSTVLHNTAWLGGATAVQRDVDFLRRDDALAALDAAIDAARAAQEGKA